LKDGGVIKRKDERNMTMDKLRMKKRKNKRKTSVLKDRGMKEIKKQWLN